MDVIEPGHRVHLAGAVAGGMGVEQGLVVQGFGVVVAAPGAQVPVQDGRQVQDVLGPAVLCSTRGPSLCDIQGSQLVTSAFTRILPRPWVLRNVDDRKCIAGAITAPGDDRRCGATIRSYSKQTERARHHTTRLLPQQPIEVQARPLVMNRRDQHGASIRTDHTSRIAVSSPPPNYHIHCIMNVYIPHGILAIIQGLSDCSWSS
nr:hypothetical protein [Dactylosporangium siamense]